MDDKHVENIPAFPSSEVVLRIKDIPPQDIFYIPQYKVVVKRERKKRNIDHSQALVPDNSSFEVLWKVSTTTPTKELGRITQFKGVYASATIDTTTEVQKLLKDKDRDNFIIRTKH